MHIIHSFNSKKVDEHVESETGFLVSNKKGNYLSLGKENFTHMQGLFFLDHAKWELYKTLEDIRLNKEASVIRNNFFNVQRVYDGGTKETFNLFNDSMLYSVKKYDGEIVIELDFRAMFDFDDKGRIYSISQHDDIIIKYDKYTDDSLSSLDKTSFLVIKGAKEFRLINEWVKKGYPYDARRKSKSEFYIYRAIGIKVDKQLDLVFSFSDDEHRAKEHAHRVYRDKEHLVSSLKKYAGHTFMSKDIALNSAMKALDDLLVTVERKERSVGIFAGLPWFYQLWARDELISLKALMLQEKYYLVKRILFKYLGSISSDGLVPNILPANKGDKRSIDAVGWLFLRTKEFLKLLTAKKILNEYMTVQDLIRIKRQLEKTIQGMVHISSYDGLIVNDEQETWMDTKAAMRKGACIEIQTLFLSMISLHNHIASITNSKQIFRVIEKDLKQKVRKEFFKKGMLYDSIRGILPDDTIRPNIFLAYYIYPALLSKNGWKQAFDTVLKELWADWGGLSTVSHKSPLFKIEYTGEDDVSYHNGNSWFYINNYAALAMHRLDKSYYAKYIKRVLHASKEELLFSGFVGCCAELSSSKHMRSEGCLSQAWSAASFIELMYGLQG